MTDKDKKPMIICWRCRDKVQAADETYSESCKRCGFSFRGEVVEIQYESLERLIEEEYERYGAQ